MALADKLALAGVLVGSAGLLVTAAGFVLAIIQLRRTARAAEATQLAVERTEQRATLNHLLVLLPQFRLIENDLDYAAESDDQTLTMRALIAYAHIGHEVAALLRGQEGVDEAVLDRLEATARSASRVKSEVVTSTRKMKNITAEIRIDIADVSGTLSGLASHFRIQAGNA